MSVHCFRLNLDIFSKFESRFSWAVEFSIFRNYETIFFPIMYSTRLLTPFLFIFSLQYNNQLALTQNLQQGQRAKIFRLKKNNVLVIKTFSTSVCFTPCLRNFSFFGQHPLFLSPLLFVNIRNFIRNASKKHEK